MDSRWYRKGKSGSQQIRNWHTLGPLPRKTQELQKSPRCGQKASSSTKWFVNDLRTRSGHGTIPLHSPFCHRYTHYCNVLTTSSSVDPLDIKQTIYLRKDISLDTTDNPLMDWIFNYFSMSATCERPLLRTQVFYANKYMPLSQGYYGIQFILETTHVHITKPELLRCTVSLRIIVRLFDLKHTLKPSCPIHFHCTSQNKRETTPTAISHLWIGVFVGMASMWWG